MLQALHARHAAEAPARLKQLQRAAVANENLFAELMETVKVCSLGQVTNALFEVGGAVPAEHVIADFADFNGLN